MARLEIEKPADIVAINRRRIQEAQCCDRWTGKCINEDCWAFQKVDGDFFCSKNFFQNQS
ncbi:MAG: hypothetical protein P8Y18_01780 [Candidatus Bathyarchaeota archaeon]